MAPARNRAVANRATDGASPAARIPAPVSRVPRTAARAEPMRRMSSPAARPAVMAPAGNAATARP
ncbi:hypothetical protein SBADM41S_01485 [Streptomyces badius]